ncbi:44183_t:CDS:2, partial [Gigaspora margarita]
IPSPTTQAYKEELNSISQKVTKQKQVTISQIIIQKKANKWLYKLLKELGLIKDSSSLITQIYNDYKLSKKQGSIADEGIEEKYLKADEIVPE